MDDPLAHLPGYALRRAANAMMAAFAARLAAIGMRVSDASVLMLVAERKNVTASQIGRVLDIQRTNMVPILNRMEAAGLIDRLPLDGKSLAIVLTTAGIDRLTQVRAIAENFEAELLDRIPAEHRAHFVPALHALWR